jgi:hypothetical protein
MRENVKTEGDENNEQISNTEIQRGGRGGCLSVLNRGKEGQGEKYPSSTGMGREGNKENGRKGMQMRRNW